MRRNVVIENGVWRGEEMPDALNLTYAIPLVQIGGNVLHDDEDGPELVFDSSGDLLLDIMTPSGV